MVLGDVVAAALACLLYVWGVDRSGYALAYWPAAVASLNHRLGKGR